MWKWVLVGILLGLPVAAAAQSEEDDPVFIEAQAEQLQQFPQLADPPYVQFWDEVFGGDEEPYNEQKPDRVKESAGYTIYVDVVARDPYWQTTIEMYRIMQWYAWGNLNGDRGMASCSLYGAIAPIVLGGLIGLVPGGQVFGASMIVGGTGSVLVNCFMRNY